MSTTKKVGNTNVTISEGDMTAIKADAYIVPEFQGGASYGGVGGAVANAGGNRGLGHYQKYVDDNGKQKYGTVISTPSGGGNAAVLLHAVTVGSGEENEFAVVQDAVFNALTVAKEQGLHSLAMPALGTGIIGDLEDDQSAKAMLSAVEEFSKAAGDPMNINIVIFRSPRAYRAFSEVLNTASYKDVTDQKGKRDFDPGRWADGMNFHVRTQNKFQARKQDKPDFKP